MQTSRHVPTALLASLVILACGDDDDTPSDAGTTPDAGAAADAGAAPDAGPPDTGVADGGGSTDAGSGMTAIQIPGVSAPVEVRVDARNVVSIKCQTDLDCFRAQGYMHAYYRFGQMDLRRRSVRGGLSELAGDAAVDIDANALTFFANRQGEPLWEQILAGATEASRAGISAYTAGVNAWIADLRAERNGARLTLEWESFENQIEDWEDLDSVACILALLEQLTNQSGAEISRGGLFAQLPAAQALDLFGIRPSTSATVLPQNGKPSPRPTVADLEALQAQLRPFAPLFQRAQLVSGNDLRTGDGLAGSNNWVVAPSAAAGDDALFANDPHLALTNPSIWFLVNLDSAEGLHVAGASFAGLPDVILGHNENIAWGATVAFFDMADVYLEQLAPDGSGVVFNGQVVPFITRQFTIEVSGGAPVTRTALYVPHHGPVVALDAMAGTALTIKWTGQDADTDLDFLFEMSKAASVDEAQVALRKVTTVGQNFVVADRTGNIGWFPYNRVPNRPWAVATPSWLPLSGDGSFEWMGSVPIEMLPQSKNPAQGYIATANNDMTGALADGNNANEGQAALQHFVAAGYRQASILDRLSSGAGQHDLASMQTIQGDVKSGVGEDIVPAILQAVSGRTLSANAQAVADALTAWDFECPTGLDGIDPMTSNPTADMAVRGSATGCAAFHVLFPRLYAAIFDDELGAAGVDSLPTTAALTDAIVRPGRLLGGTYFDDVSTASVTETAGDVFEAAMDSAGMYLTTTLGASSSDWLWGRLHTVTLRADLFDAVGIPFFNQGPYANDGGLFTIDVANTQSATEDLYDHRSGASMRFACALGASGVRCTMELPGGQAHFADTPTPQGTLQEYLTNQPFELVFDEATAESTAVQRWTIMGN